MQTRIVIHTEHQHKLGLDTRGRVAEHREKLHWNQNADPIGQLVFIASTLHFQRQLLTGQSDSTWTEAAQSSLSSGRLNRD